MTLIRRTPIKRSRPKSRAEKKKAHPERFCVRARCYDRPYRAASCDGLCKGHLTEALDDAARARCLRDYGLWCSAEGFTAPNHAKACSPDSGTTSVQWAHIVRRGRGLTRRLDGNARPLCGVHHTYFTHNPEAWTLFVDELIGVEEHRELMRRSLADEQMDLEAEWVSAGLAGAA